MTFLIKKPISENLQNFFLKSFPSFLFAEGNYAFKGDKSRNYIAVLGVDEKEFASQINDYFSDLYNLEDFNASVGADYLWSSMPRYDLTSVRNDNGEIFFVAFWPNILTKFETSSYHV